MGHGCLAAPASPSPASRAPRLPPASGGRPLCALDSSACFMQSLQRLLLRWCSQMLPPPQSLHSLLLRWCSQKADPPQSLHRNFSRWCGHSFFCLRSASILLSSVALIGNGWVLRPAVISVHLWSGNGRPYQRRCCSRGLQHCGAAVLGSSNRPHLRASPAHCHRLPPELPNRYTFKICDGLLTEEESWRC